MDRSAEMRIEFVPEYAGRYATGYGGGPAGPGLGFGSRATYVGRLSGRRMLFGDPPWSWLELDEITERSDGADGDEGDRVWCDEGNVFLHEPE